VVHAQADVSAQIHHAVSRRTVSSAGHIPRTTGSGGGWRDRNDVWPAVYAPVHVRRWLSACRLPKTAMIPKERYPDFFEINMLRCIYCGYCEEVCPEEAIVMSKDYDLVFETREEAVYDKSKLLVRKEELKDRLEYLREYKNRQFGQFWNFDEDNNIHSVRNRDKRWETSLSLVEMIEEQRKKGDQPELKRD
jgi:ferredoxin